MTIAEMPEPVAAAFRAMPEQARVPLLAVRGILLDAAAADPRIGPLTETLKWGEPAYLTAATGSGSTVRLGVSRSDARPALFVNCRTSLAADIAELHGATFGYQAARAVLLPTDIAAHADAIRHAVTLALTYHLRRRASARRS